MLSFAAVTLTGLALLVPAASAVTAPQSTNTIADQAAILAYHAYLSTLVLDAPTAAARATALVQGVNSTCPDALSDLNQLSASQLQRSALTAFGHEVDADLDLAYIGAGAPALNRLAGALGALTWSTQAQSSTTVHLIASERALAAITSPDLCRDATALDGAPLSEPTTTKRFMARYRASSSSLNTNLTAFQELLAKFETSSESKLVGQINSLVGQYSALSSATEQTDASSLLSDLGISS